MEDKNENIYLLSGSENNCFCYWNLSENQNICDKNDIIAKGNNPKTVNCITSSSTNNYLACTGFPDTESKIYFYLIN